MPLALSAGVNVSAPVSSCVASTVVAALIVTPFNASVPALLGLTRTDRKLLLSPAASWKPKSARLKT